MLSYVIGRIGISEATVRFPGYSDFAVRERD